MGIGRNSLVQAEKPYKTYQIKGSIPLAPPIIAICDISSKLRFPIVSRYVGGGYSSESLQKLGRPNDPPTAGYQDEQPAEDDPH